MDETAEMKLIEYCNVFKEDIYIIVEKIEPLHKVESRVNRFEIKSLAQINGEILLEMLKRWEQKNKFPMEFNYY